MTTTDTRLFAKVREHMKTTTLVAWDGCHKIYLAKDEEQADWFADNYDYTLSSTYSEMLERVGEWWDSSCPLRFVNAVVTNYTDPNDGFTTLIPQGGDWDDETVDSMVDWGGQPILDILEAIDKEDF